MCRNIKRLRNPDHAPTDAELHDAALQFVPKISGFNKPSQSNQAAFDHAIEEVSDAARRLLKSLETGAAPRDRDTEAMKARERAKARFA